jgi:hypothetical protein
MSEYQCLACDNLCEIEETRVVEDVCYGHGIINTETYWVEVSACCEAEYKMIEAEECEEK